MGRHMVVSGAHQAVIVCEPSLLSRMFCFNTGVLDAWGTEHVSRWCNVKSGKQNRQAHCLWPVSSVEEHLSGWYMAVHSNTEFCRAEHRLGGGKNL